MKSMGHSVYMGANAYFTYANEKKLLDKEIEFLTYDDKYEPEIMLENTNKFLENKNIFSFFAFVGTPTIKKIIPLIYKSEIPFVAAITGANFLRTNDNDNIVNFRSSYENEIHKTIQYLHKKKNITKFSVFYQNDDYGESGYLSVIKTLKYYNLEILTNGSYKRNTLSVKHAINDIFEKKPEAIIMIGANKANSLFINLIREEKINENIVFANISFGDADEMVKGLNYKTNNILFSQVVPSYTDDSIEIVKKYKELMSKYYPSEKLGFISLEAFISAKITVDALVRMEGDYNKINFIEQLNILKYKYLKNKVFLYGYSNKKFVEIISNDK